MAKIFLIFAYILFLSLVTICLLSVIYFLYQKLSLSFHRLGKHIIFLYKRLLSKIKTRIQQGKECGRYIFSIISIAITPIKLSWLRIKKHNVIDFSDYRYCIIALMSKIIKADQDINESELDKAKSTIRRYYKTEAENKQALKKFQDILDNDLIILNQICEKINDTLNYVAKSELIMELLAIAYVDNSFNYNEKLMIETIVNRLKITPQEYKSIFAIFFKKYKQGFYNDACPTVYTPSGINPSDTKYENENQDEGERKKQSDGDNENHNSYQRYNGMSEDEAYSILGIEHTDSDVEVKKAYRALAIKYHPDNAASLGEEAIRQATESMKQINMAWEVVKMARGIK